VPAQFVRLPAAGVALLVILACTSDLTRPAPLIAVRSVAADTNQDDDILLHVVPEAASIIDVVYWTDSAHKMRYRTTSPSMNATVLVPAVRPGRVYEYDVSAVNDAGVTGPPTHGQFSSPIISSDLQLLNLSAIGTLGAPYAMLEVAGSFSGFVAVNGEGEPVWHWRTRGRPQGFTRRANGNFVFLDGVYGLSEVTPDGRTVHQLEPLPNGDRAPHHDVIATPANTLLFIAQDARVSGDTIITGEAIWEWSPEAGTIQKRWTAFDFLDPTVDVGPRSTRSDWLHGNSLALGDHGNIILSLNWISQVVSIAPDWHSFEWRIGGTTSTVALDADAKFQGQHTASVLPNGHLLVFDNGRDRTGTERLSRAAEVAFQPHGAGHLVWSFRPTPDIYAPYVGAARRLENGNTLVYFGMKGGFAGATGPMAAYEARPDGSVAWRLTFDGGNIAYRATPMYTIAGETSNP